MPNTIRKQTVRFDDFELDLEREELRFQGEAVAIQPLPLKALVVLVSETGKLVPRDQLQAALWPGSDSDVERSLNHTIRKLRQTLGDDTKQPRYIQTVPRRGYRFIGRLEISIDDQDTLHGSPRLRSTTKAGDSPFTRLRILDFQGAADDRAWPHLFEGMREELISRLVDLRLSGLVVLDDSFRREELEDETTTPFFGLRGFMRRTGTTVVVNAFLVQCPEGVVVAATSLRQELGNVLDLQGDAAGHIVQRLILPLLQPSSQDPPTAGQDSLPGEPSAG